MKKFLSKIVDNFDVAVLMYMLCGVLLSIGIAELFTGHYLRAINSFIYTFIAFMCAKMAKRIRDLRAVCLVQHKMIVAMIEDEDEADAEEEDKQENEPHDTPKVTVEFTEDVAEEDHDLLYNIANESAKAITELVKEKNEDGLMMTADALASEWRKRTKHDYGDHRPGVRIDFRSFADDGIVVVKFDLDTVIEGKASV